MTGVQTCALPISLRGARLLGVDFTEALLYGADFSGAELDEVDLTDAAYDDETVWPLGFNPRRRGAAHVANLDSETLA